MNCSFSNYRQIKVSLELQKLTRLNYLRFLLIKKSAKAGPHVAEDSNLGL